MNPNKPLEMRSADYSEGYMTALTDENGVKTIVPAPSCFVTPPPPTVAALISVGVAFMITVAAIIGLLAGCGRTVEPTKQTPNERRSALTKGHVIFVLKDGSIVIDPAVEPKTK